MEQDGRLIGQNMFMETVITGVYQTPHGYYVEDSDVEEFDKGFPAKKKLKLPGQIF